MSEFNRLSGWCILISRVGHSYRMVRVGLSRVWLRHPILVVVCRLGDILGRTRLLLLVVPLLLVLRLLKLGVVTVLCRGSLGRGGYDVRYCSRRPLPRLRVLLERLRY